MMSLNVQYVDLYGSFVPRNQVFGSALCTLTESDLKPALQIENAEHVKHIYSELLKLRAHNVNIVVFFSFFVSDIRILITLSK
jgi:hypothetical protein